MNEQTDRLAECGGTEQIVKTLRWLANETKSVFAQKQLRAAADMIDRLTADNTYMRGIYQVVCDRNEALTAENTAANAEIARLHDLLAERNAALDKQDEETYSRGVRYAIYEIMKEADIPGSNEIRNSGDNDDGMCAQVAECIKSQLSEAQRREKAAVEASRHVQHCIDGADCRYDLDGIKGFIDTEIIDKLERRGPEAGKGEAE